MTHFVPDFDTDDDDHHVNVSSLNLPRKSIIAEEDHLMELLWHNGPVVTQNQRPHNPSSVKLQVAPPPPPMQPLDRNLFIQEDEMTSWLQYPLRDDDFCFMNFSRLRGSRGESGSKAIVRESTQVNPSAAGIDGRGTVNYSAVAEDLAASRLNRKGKEVATTPESEIPGASSNEPVTVDERKRKESEETKQGTSNKRSRAAQVHNLSERKRRDRINERMKALQELIPRCNKSDKASMLDEAIEYMKSLQLQIQMMSMGCGGMMPMMYPGLQQQYMPHMAMGMEMGMNRPPPPPPFMPFPNMLVARRPLPTQAHMSSYPAHASDPSRVYQQFGPTPTHPGYMDPYQQFRSLQPPQFQNQATSHPSSSRVSVNKESKDQGNHTTG